MKRITLSCSCGASIVLEDATGTYAYARGESGGPRMRKFQIETFADDWLDRHAPCVASAPRGDDK